MTEATYYPLFNTAHADYIMNVLDTTWATLHDAASGTLVGQHVDVRIQADNVSNQWSNITRGIPCFYVPTLPGLTLAGKVRLWCTDVINQFPGTTPAIGIYGSTPANPALIAVEDFDQVGTTLLSNEIALSSLVENDWNEFTLNAAGLAALAAPITKLGLRIDYDVDNIAPAWSSNAQMFALFHSNYFPAVDPRPELVLTYTTLSVRTDPVTEISSGNAQMNGTLLSAGGAATVTCSHLWGLTSACELGELPIGGTVVTEGNSWLTVITGLSPNTKYYCKAKATDGTATVYGDVVSWTEASYPSRPLTRVTGIRDVFRAGPEPQYYMELHLGGLETEWIPPYSKFTPTIGEDVNQQPGKPQQKLATFPSDFTWMAKNMNTLFPGNAFKQYVDYQMQHPDKTLTFEDFRKGKR